MYLYIIYYLLIGIALIIGLFIHYTEYSDINDFYIELGCGEEYNLVIFVLIGLLWPIIFIISVVIIILNFIKYVYNMCRK